MDCILISCQSHGSSLFSRAFLLLRGSDQVQASQTCNLVNELIPLVEYSISLESGFHRVARVPVSTCLIGFQVYFSFSRSNEPFLSHHHHHHHHHTIVYSPSSSFHPLARISFRLPATILSQPDLSTFSHFKDHTMNTSNPGDNNNNNGDDDNNKYVGGRGRKKEQ